MCNYNSDILTKSIKPCGCINTSELDFLENVIIEHFIEYCKTHYLSCDDKSNYIFNKKENKYICYIYFSNNNQSNTNCKKNTTTSTYKNITSSSCKTTTSISYKKNINKPILKINTLSYCKSYIDNEIIYDNTANINIKKEINKEIKKINIEHPLHKNKKLSFGKYKNKTFNYVYNNDKLYCYKLTYWNNDNIKDNRLNLFINYIKDLNKNIAYTKVH